MIVEKLWEGSSISYVLRVVRLALTRSVLPAMGNLVGLDVDGDYLERVLFSPALLPLAYASASAFVADTYENVSEFLEINPVEAIGGPLLETLGLDNIGRDDISAWNAAV